MSLTVGFRIWACIIFHVKILGCQGIYQSVFVISFLYFWVRRKKSDSYFWWEVVFFSFTPVFSGACPIFLVHSYDYVWCGGIAHVIIAHG